MQVSPEGTVLTKSLEAPNSAAFDARATLFVADSGNQCIINSNTSQVVAGTKSVKGAELNQLKFPSGIAFDSTVTDNRDRFMYVVDTGNHRIIRWSANALYSSDLPSSTLNGQVVAGQTGTPGPELNQLNNPKSAAFDQDGNLLVADAANNRVIRFKADTLRSDTDTPSNGAAVGEVVAGHGGSRLNQLKDPRSIAFDKYGNLFVADTGNNRIMKWRKAICSLHRIAPRMRPQMGKWLQAPTSLSQCRLMGMTTCMLHLMMRTKSTCGKKVL